MILTNKYTIYNNVVQFVTKSLSVADCESLIRKMLVLEPNKRFSIQQIKKHRWMQMGVPPTLPPTISVSNTQPNEQILRLMQSLGIDSSKTREVSSISYFFNKKIIVFFILSW